MHFRYNATCKMQDSIAATLFLVLTRMSILVVMASSHYEKEVRFGCHIKDPLGNFDNCQKLILNWYI